MTLKNFLKILQRRWIALLVPGILVFAGYMYLHWREPIYYTASARVVAQSPQALEIFRNSPTGRRFLTANDLNTLLLFSKSKQVREIAGRLLKLPVLVLENNRWVYGERTDAGEYWQVGDQRIPKKDVQRVLPPDGRTVDDLPPVLISPAENANLLVFQATGLNGEDTLKAIRVFSDAAILASKEQAQEMMNNAIGYIDGLIAQNTKGSEGIESLQQRLQILRDSNHTIDLTKKYSDVRDRILTIETQLEERGLLRDRKRQELVNLREQSSRESHLRMLPVPTSVRSPERVRKSVSGSGALDSLQSRLVQLRVQLADLQEKYRPAHPDVVKTQQLVRKVEADFLAELRTVAREDTDEMELTVANEIKLIDAEIEALRQRHAEKDDALKAITPVYAEYEKAQEQLRSLTTDTRALEDIQKRIQIERSSSPGYLQPHETDERAQMLAKKTAGFIPVALLVSIMIGFGCAYLLEFLDTTLRTDYDVRRHLNIQITGIIPYTDREIDLPKLPIAHPISDAYDKMATLVTTAMESTGRAVLITSPVKGDGKTTISVNLATAIARQGRRVLLVDGDLRLPSIHKFLNIENQNGFMNLIEGLGGAADPAAEEALARTVIQETTVPNLSSITAGIAADTRSSLSPDHVARAVGILKRMFDTVVFDSSPVLLTSEPLKIAAAVDLCYLVISAGKTVQTEANFTKQLLKNVGADIAGIFLNKAPTEGTETYYYYYYDYYRSGGHRGARRHH